MVFFRRAAVADAVERDEWRHGHLW